MPELFKRGDEVVLIKTPDDEGPDIGCRGVVINIDQYIAQDRGFLINVSWEKTTWDEGSTGYDADGKEYLNCWWVHGDCLNYDQPRNFYLVGIIDGKEVVLQNTPTFDLGKEAAEHAAKLTAELGFKVQPRRFSTSDNDAWRKREELRIADGTYIPLPQGWNLEPIKDHFLHRAKDEPFMVAYTESLERGVLDRQTRTTPGRYLERYYPHLGQEERNRLIALVDGPNGVLFAATTEEIVSAYLRGPRSCMSHSLSDYSTSIHPVSVYGESDLQVAYLKDDSRITARALVWPEKKLIGRMYGDAARLRTALNAFGYKEASNGILNGARIRKIFDQDEEAFVVPYLDGVGTAHDPDPDDADGFLVLTRGGNVYAENTNGYGTHKRWCPKSKHWASSGSFVFVHGANEEWSIHNCRGWVRVGLETWAQEFCVEFAGRGCTPKAKAKNVDDLALSAISRLPILPEDLTVLGDGKTIAAQEIRHTMNCRGTGKRFLTNDMDCVNGEYYSLAYLRENKDIYKGARPTLKRPAKSDAWASLDTAMDGWRRREGRSVSVEPVDVVF